MTKQKLIIRWRIKSVNYVVIRDEPIKHINK